jgi:broad specificity phosphatase PhoE
MIAFIRHGETAWNRERRIQGTLDVPLSPVGRARVEAYAGCLAGTGIRRIWTSPLRRARETAHILACGVSAASPPDVRELESLRERNYGLFQGRRLDELDAGGRIGREEHMLGGNGVEDWEQLEWRVREALAVILQGPSPCVAVVHGGWFKALHFLLQTGEGRRNPAHLSPLWVSEEKLADCLQSISRR